VGAKGRVHGGMDGGDQGLTKNSMRKLGGEKKKNTKLDGRATEENEPPKNNKKNKQKTHRIRDRAKKKDGVMEKNNGGTRHKAEKKKKKKKCEKRHQKGGHNRGTHDRKEAHQIPFTPQTRAIWEGDSNDMHKPGGGETK